MYVYAARIFCVLGMMMCLVAGGLATAADGAPVDTESASVAYAKSGRDAVTGATKTKKGYPRKRGNDSRLTAQKETGNTPAEKTTEKNTEKTSDGTTATGTATTASTATSAAPTAKKLTPRPLRIVTSFYPMYIATRNIALGLDGVTVLNLTRPQTGCLHDYQMTTQDVRNLSTANIFVVNGAGMEAFLGKVISELPKLRVVEASTGIELIKGDGHEGDNPHVWVSVSLHIKQIENIAVKLAEYDPARAESYAANAAVYIAKLQVLRDEMHAGLKDISSRDIITFHEAFPYFAKEFGLNIAAVVEREPGSEPSAKELIETIRLVKKAHIKAVFVEPQYPKKAAQVVAKEALAKVYTLDPCVTGPDNPDAYLSIMRANLLVLQKALK